MLIKFTVHNGKRSRCGAKLWHGVFPNLPAPPASVTSASAVPVGHLTLFSSSSACERGKVCGISGVCDSAGVVGCEPGDGGAGGDGAGRWWGGGVLVECWRDWGLCGGHAEEGEILNVR